MRHTGMRPGTAALIAAVVLLAGGCGDGRQRESPPQAAQFRDCTMRTFDSVGRPVATLHADGDRVPVRLVPPGARRCPASLIVRSGSGVSGTRVSGLDLDPTTARVVKTRGADGQELLALDSRRGPAGVQTHLFTPLAQEVRVGGHPLLPVIESGHRVPADATCTAGGGIAVTTAQAHEPPGIVLAWDVTRTTYTLDGGQARGTRSASVARAVADPTLRRQHPELYDGRLLAGCGERPA